MTLQKITFLVGLFTADAAACAANDGKGEAAACECGVAGATQKNVAIGEGCITTGVDGAAGAGTIVPICASSNGSVAELALCACGTGVAATAIGAACKKDHLGAGTTIASGAIPDAAAILAAQCAYYAGNAASADDCICGNVRCYTETGLYCWKADSLCLEEAFPFVSVADTCDPTGITKITQDACQCGTGANAKYCSKNQYCQVNKDAAATCIGTAVVECIAATLTGATANIVDAGCGCFSQTCADNEFCFKTTKETVVSGACSTAKTTACTPGTTAVAAGGCRCSTDAGTFCEEGYYCTAAETCQQYLDCTSDGIAVTAADTKCKCTNDTCDAGEVCFGGACSDPLLTCAVTNASAAVGTTACNCGGDRCVGADKFCDADGDADKKCLAGAVTGLTGTDGTAAAAGPCGTKATCTATQFCYVATGTTDGECLAAKREECATTDGTAKVDSATCVCGAAACPNATDYCVSGGTGADKKSVCVEKVIGDAVSGKYASEKAAGVSSVTVANEDNCTDFCTDSDSAGNAACLGQFVTTMGVAMNSL